MMLVDGSMIGVPVIPTVFGISPQEVSDDANGGRRVREVIVAPVNPSNTRTMFWFETTMTCSCDAPGGVYTKGLA